MLIMLLIIHLITYLHTCSRRLHFSEIKDTTTTTTSLISIPVCQSSYCFGLHRSTIAEADVVFQPLKQTRSRDFTSTIAQRQIFAQIESNGRQIRKGPGTASGPLSVRAEISADCVYNGTQAKWIVLRAEMVCRQTGSCRCIDGTLVTAQLLALIARRRSTWVGSERQHWRTGIRITLKYPRTILTCTLSINQFIKCQHTVLLISSTYPILEPQ